MRVESIRSTTMTLAELAEHIHDRKSGKDSVDDQIQVAKFLWEEEYHPTSDGIKKSELSEKIEESDIELGFALGTSLKHLRDIDVVRRWIRGPQILIIHEDRGVINGEDLEAIVNNEIESLVAAMQDDDPPEEGGESTAVADGGDELTIRDVAADELEVDPTDVENHLRTGDVPDRMEKLSDVVEAVEESPVDKNGEYYSVFFIHNPYRYSLTAKAVNLCEE